MNLDSVAAIYNAVPTDWMLIGAFAIFAAFDCLRSGARRATTLALALPPAALLSAAIPEAAFLGTLAAQFSTPLLEAILFFMLLIGMYILIMRIGLSWGTEGGQTLQAALSGVAITALVVTFWLQTPALDALYHFGPQVQAIFADMYRFWWLIAGYAALAFVRGSA